MTDQPMTKDEFIAYAHQALSVEALEPLYEMISEFNSEVAMFGDGGPGSLLWLQAAIRQVKSIERQLARLEGRAPREFHFAVRCPA